MSNDSLYPVAEPSLASHQRVLQLHARRLETSLTLDQARNERLKRMEAATEELERNMNGMAEKLVELQLAMARSHNTTRIIVALLTAGGVLLARLVGH